MNILFLGGGKRVSLLEAFQRALHAEDVRGYLFSIDDTMFAPIVGIAGVEVGPDFWSPAFPDLLFDIIQSRLIDIVIPLTDAATVVLSRVTMSVLALGAWPVVSAAERCSALHDKRFARVWFDAAGVPYAPDDGWPRIAKPRNGYGGRGQAVLRNADEYDAFCRGRDRSAYHVERFLVGLEYTVDAYADPRGQLIAALSRVRQEVVGGEVMVSQSRHHAGVLELTKRAMAVPGWRGPVTLQFIDDEMLGVRILEINPRFGGGVTHAIHLGLDFPRWLIRERLGRDPLPVPAWPDGAIMTRARRDFFFDPMGAAKMVAVSADIPR